MKEYFEPGRSLPVRAECDVLVVGGGTAGVVAAIAAARGGADTLLVEQYGFLGGTMHSGVCGMHSFFNMYQHFGVPRKQCVGGIPDEIITRLKERGATPGHIPQERGTNHFSVITTIDREAYKQLAFDMVTEAGVRLMLHTWFSDAIVEDGVIRGVIVESKAGREVILAKRVIDTTGDGDVGFRAGVPEFKDPEPYTVGMLFAMANVDIPRLAAYLDEEGVLEHLAMGDKGSEKDRYVRIATKFHGNEKLKAMAQELGIWGMFTYSLHEGELTYVNGAGGEPLEDLSPEEYTRAELETRKRIYEIANAFKRLLPGYENAYVSWTAHQLGVRRTRVLQCEHSLTRQEVVSAARFPDEIGLYGFHDSAPSVMIENGSWYGVPYRAILPLGVEGLLLAGRMITFEKEAHMSTRNSVCCMLEGQAAGSAAALSLRLGVQPRDLDPQILRSRLRGDGVILD